MALNLAATTTPSLIVNADGFGLSEVGNRELLEAATNGIVTDTSVVASSDLTPDMFETLEKTFPGGVGIHFNLTAGRPLTAAPSLTQPDGSFWPRGEMWKRAAGEDYEFDEVLREFDAQIKRLTEAGLKVFHASGHDHIHVIGDIFFAAAQACREHGIFFIRLPDEPRTTGDRLDPEDARSRICEWAQTRWMELERYELRAVAFGGLFRPDFSRLESVLQGLEELPEGVTEWMWEPGRAELPAAAGGGEAREKPLTVLTHQAVKEKIVELELKLISFADLLS